MCSASAPCEAHNDVHTLARLEKRLANINKMADRAEAQGNMADLLFAIEYGALLEMRIERIKTRMGE